MISKAALISVIIPTYNRAHLVCDAIESVLAQTYSHYEIIVVDDGSTDGTGELLRKRYGDRIRYEWQENQGESVARNRGIALARGEYIAFLDSDDLWLPEKLEKQIAYLKAHPEVSAVFCQAYIIDARGIRQPGILGADLTPKDLTLESLLLANTISGPSTTTTTTLEFLRKVGGFDPAIRFAEDWDLWLRFRLAGEIGYLPEPLACVRMHSNNQWRLPKKEQIERSLKDHLRLLDRAFAACRDSIFNWELLRRRSFAKQYAEAAFNGYARGLYAQAGEWLKKAIELDAQTWTSDAIQQHLIETGAAMIIVKPDLSIQWLQDYVYQSVLHLPEGIKITPRQQRKMISALCSHKGYHDFVNRKYRRSLYFTVWAALYDPGQINAGMLKRALYAASHCLLRE